MLSRFARLPLRRQIHTQAARRHPSKYVRTALGASAITAAYLTWRSFSDPIALDSSATTQPLQKPTVSSKPPSRASVTSPLSDSTPEAYPVPNSGPSSEHSTPNHSDHNKTSSNNHVEDSGEQEGESEESSSKGASGGAFNPETGEINWDCPCLGGMAHGPCGPDFREAFSCFVFSEQEPKGIDCVEKFKAMQDCFRRHPEVYSDEIMDDDEEEEAVTASAPEAAPVTARSGEGSSIPPQKGPPPTSFGPSH